VNTPTTVGSLYQYLIDELSQANIEKPHLEARMLLTYVIGIDQTHIFAYPEREINPKFFNHLSELTARRKANEPIAYITGTQEFWSLNFTVTKDTLIPRPDSETVIEATIAAVVDKMAPLTILDLGTGSGCLLLALLSEMPHARGIGIDISPLACKVAEKNAENLGLKDRAKFCQGNWLAGVKDTFDIIVSNPPYIAEKNIHTLDKDVKNFEPHLALSGGVDGLVCYRIIAEQSINHLNRGGIIAIEIGINQGLDINRIFLNNKFKLISIHKDTANIDRCILATHYKS